MRKSSAPRSRYAGALKERSSPDQEGEHARSTGVIVCGAVSALASLQAAWGLWFVWRTSFEVGGSRAHCLFDDAMTSMAYARNFVEGYGLNWARYGSPVEGFTCPLWTFLMVPVHLLGLPLVKTSLVIQLLSLALLVANVMAVRRLSLAHFAPHDAGASRLAAWLPAAVLTAFYYPLNHWALQGMETGLQALLTTLAVYLGLSVATRNDRRARAYGRLFAVLAAAYLTRMDMAILAVVVLAFVAWRGGLGWREQRCWLPGASLLLAAILGYELFRWFYFGDLLPNTYYLKLAGIPLEVRLLRGAWAFGRFAAPVAPILAAVGAALVPLLRRSGRALLPLAVVLAFFAYSVWVGGDAWESAGVGANRFIAFAMPLVFVLFGAGLQRILERPLLQARGARTAVATAATVAALLLANHLFSPGDLRRFLVLDRPLHVDGHERFVRQTLRLRKQGLVPEHARVAVVWSGIPAYFSNWEMVDLLGYNDRWVARQPPSIPLSADTWRNFRPGHVKLGYEHALAVHHPDLVFQTWRPDGGDWTAELRRHGYVPRGLYWVRGDR